MGCCYSGEEDSSGQNDEIEPLLSHQNPVSKPPNGTDWTTTSVPSAQTDGQALLTSILTKTAQNIIDVSAADSVVMEQHEIMDKARQYSTKLAVLSTSLPQKKALSLPSLTSQPHQVLASDLVPYSDVQQVSKIAAYAYSAISQIKVDAKEELVVQFAIP
ncbi:ragulator complex protein LAMTOR1 isoform X2 [Cyprinodon tularosa]|uniref:ragulator complex protein LAMTOR1 isoform X2 n=1 Tax=Cyprinodon variegatus TaxID=28743 RepID=UPI00074268B5|nr:PREDICTED: ragulator complex protein LAMTOR1 isoform X2 [Cyprinodon variegatus]XP_038123897.1 ragulator complex protein LAMTOR1 isoform X2 [Cyprinodon tularosa]